MSDLIDRQAAQRLFRKAISFKEHVGKMMWSSSEVKEWVAEFIEDLPSAEPEIIHCKDCRKHNVKIGFDEDGHTVWKEDACPLVSWRGKAKGHEFDYQHCSCAELRGEKDEQSDLQTGCD